MKHILSKNSSYFYGLSNALFSILILTAVTLQPRISFGQAEKLYESMLISDAAIPDFLAMAKTDVVHEDSMRLMFKIKEDSLKNRLKQAQSSFEILKVRADQAEAALERWQNEAEKVAREAQASSTGFPTSRGAAEQLLIAAQLELQKVTWDLASEVELPESVAIASVAIEVEKSEKRAQLFEEQLSIKESERIAEDLKSAEKNLELVDALLKKGAADVSEVDTARQSVTKAKHSLQIHELRSQIAVAQREALKYAQSAEIKMQVRKLTVRKAHIEKYINELADSTNALTAMESRLARARRSEESIATISKSLNELQIKKDEIGVLLEAVKSVEFAEKKE